MSEKITCPHSSPLSKKKSQYCADTHLRIGHSSLNGHLHRLNLRDNPNCDHCHQTETIEHILMSCSRYYSYRISLKALKAKLQSLGIDFTVPHILGKNTSDSSVRKKLFRFLTIFLKNSHLIEKI